MSLRRISRRPRPGSWLTWPLAAENARNFSERNNIELDLAYLSGDWRGLPGKIERFLADSGCEDPNWVAGIIAASGLADRYTERAREIRKCDPMWSHAWFTESRAFLWAGDKEEALRVAREGIEVAPGGWLSIALVRALVANGLYEEADHAITTQFRLQEDGLMANILKSAAMGDRDAAASFFEELMRLPNPRFSMSPFTTPGWVTGRTPTAGPR